MEFSLISMWIMLSLFHTVESNRLPQLQEWNIFWMFCAFCMFRLWREIFSFLVHHFELSILYFKPFLHVFVLFSFTTLLKHSACTMYYQFYLNDYFSFFIVNSFWFFFFAFFDIFFNAACWMQMKSTSHVLTSFLVFVVTRYIWLFFFDCCAVQNFTLNWISTSMARIF